MNKGEYKYLSPFIHKYKNSYEMLFCNRGLNKNFYGEINFAKSKNLKIWKKIKKKITPNNYKKIKSFINPFIFKHNRKSILFLEAQMKSKSEIFYSDSQFSKIRKFKKLPYKGSYLSPFLLKEGNKIFMFYSYSKKSIRCSVYDKEFRFLESFICFNANLDNEKFSIYSPYVFKFRKNYYMFYSAWKNKNEGNINIAQSKNCIDWKKTKKNVFELTNQIKIISEPFIVFKRKVYIFYEFKIESLWNINFEILSIKQFCKLLKI